MLSVYFFGMFKKGRPITVGKILAFFILYLKDDHISMLLLERKRIWRGVILDLIPKI